MIFSGDPVELVTLRLAITPVVLPVPTALMVFWLETVVIIDKLMIRMMKVPDGMNFFIA